MKKTAKGILIQYARGAYAALAQHATVAIAQDSDLIDVPGAPYFCQSLLKWRGDLIPVMDLRSLLNAAPVTLLRKEPNVLVVAYQTQAYHPLEYGALLIESLPSSVEVSSDMECEFPLNSDYWPLIAQSCFQHAGDAVPILDVKRLFSQGHQ